jgi:WXXGXW repeat (2 copies)
MLAQADDLAPPPSPDAIVTTPPPAPLAEPQPPPFPGYAWDPGHWAWDGAQYVWEPGRYIVQPANGDVRSRVLAAILQRMGLGG